MWAATALLPASTPAPALDVPVVLGVQLKGCFLNPQSTNCPSCNTNFKCLSLFYGVPTDGSEAELFVRLFCLLQSNQLSERRISFILVPKEPSLVLYT